MFGRMAWYFRRPRYIGEMMLGDYAIKQSDFSAAADHFGAAVAIAQQNHRYAGDERLARSLTNCAAALKKLKRYDEAIRHYKYAIALCRRIPEASATEVFYAAVRNLARLYGERSGIEHRPPQGHGSYPINDYWLSHVLWAAGSHPELMALLELSYGVQTLNTVRNRSVSPSSSADPQAKRRHYLQDFVNAFIDEGPKDAKDELTAWFNSDATSLAEHIGIGSYVTPPVGRGETGQPTTQSSKMMPKMNGVADLVSAIKSCQELRTIFENLVSLQDRLMGGLDPNAYAAWGSASAAFLQHLGEHHGWTPNSQADLDELMQSIDDVAEELGM